MHVNVDSYRRCWYGTSDNGEGKADTGGGLLDKNNVMISLWVFM